MKATLLKSLDSAVLCGWFVCGLFLSASASSSLTSSSGFFFNKVSNFDDRKVINDAGALDLNKATLTKCASACSIHDWCTSFFYTNGTGACSLHATVFVGPSFASVSVGTRYYKQIVDWCPSDNQTLYNRLAEMCVYFEQDINNLATGPTEADNACVSRGMRLAYNLSPLKMDALLNFTKKNTNTFTKAIYIGLRRVTPQQTPMEWIDGTPLDTDALAPYWEPNQPNGHTSNQNCVVIRAHSDSTLNDITCGSNNEFVCELMKN